MRLLIIRLGKQREKNRGTAAAREESSSGSQTVMEIRCRCSACQAKFKVAAKYAGKKARCPKCQQVCTEVEPQLVAL